MPHLFLFHTADISRLIQIAVLAGVAVPPNLHAQEYPGKAITVIVPFPAGGPSDVVARIVTEQMSKRLGQSMIIENVGGGGGTIGSARVASAQPDGYTLQRRLHSWGKTRHLTN
jgi:tripartite-type tricarboxylate transporter receptor subunit TctC